MKLRSLMSNVPALLTIVATVIVSACTPQGNGTIVFTANGEDFVRQGFIDKNGWAINFDKVLVNIANPEAYNADGLKSVLNGSHFVDLAAGDANAEPIVVGKTEKVVAGNYQSLKFNIRRATEGEYKGYSIIMIGNAKKAGKTVPFTIKLDEEIDFDGKEGFVGDEIKGMLAANGETTVEMTFHFDHIFGDKEAAADEHVNTGSVGFDFFNTFAKNGKVDVTQQMLKEDSKYQTLIGGLSTLGHLGEGHCEVSNMTSIALIGKD